MDPVIRKQPELTIRALAAGIGFGILACLSNLYVGLKSMVAVSVGATASIVCFSVHRLLARVFPRSFGAPLSLLENNILQTAASATGYGTGGAIISASAAYVLLGGRQVPYLALLLWTFFLSALGIFVAIPLKRLFIDTEKLAFPTGKAIAATLRSLHSENEQAVRPARALAVSALIAAVIAIWRDGLKLIRGWAHSLPSSVALPGAIHGVPASNFSFSFDVGVLGIGVGALIGFRVTFWILVGALICFGGIAPRLFPTGGYEAILNWSIWPGAGILASSSFIHLAIQSRSAWRGLLPLVRNPDRQSPEVSEIPSRWFIWGTPLFAIGAALVARVAFDIPLPQALLGIGLSAVLCVIACRVTGETDTNPSGALSMVNQLLFGALLPQNVGANLGAATIAGNSTASAADILTSLKAGAVLGSSPRRQFLAELLGCAVGSLAIVSAFYVLVPDASALGTERFPAPGATMALGVARICASGIGHLSEPMRWGLAGGACVGLLLGLLDAAIPQRFRSWVPSPVGLGLSFLLPASLSLSLFLGGLAAATFRRIRARSYEQYGEAISSGFIAGESLVGVALAMFAAAGL